MKLFLCCTIIICSYLIVIPSTGLCDNTVKIGALIHITGEFAPSGKAFTEGVELATSDANDAGGVNGAKVEIEFDDTQYKPAITVSGAKKLIQSKNVIGAVITTATEVKAAGLVLQKAKIPTITMWDSSPEIEAIGNYVFGIGPWAPSSGQRAAEYTFSTLKAKNAVIIGSNTEWSQYVMKYFRSKFESLGGKIIISNVANPDETDYRTILFKIRNLKPEAVYAPIDGNINLFFKQVRQIGLKCPIITSDIITEDNIEEEGPSLENVYQTMTGELKSAEAKGLAESYRKKYNHEMLQSSFVSWGYDATMLLVSAARAVGTDTTKIAEYLHTVKDYHGTSGIITMSPHGSAPRPVGVSQIRLGKFVEVESPR